MKSKVQKFLSRNIYSRTFSHVKKDPSSWVMFRIPNWESSPWNGNGICNGQQQISKFSRPWFKCLWAQFFRVIVLYLCEKKQRGKKRFFTSNLHSFSLCGCLDMLLPTPLSSTAGSFLCSCMQPTSSSYLCYCPLCLLCFVSRAVSIDSTLFRQCPVFKSFNCETKWTYIPHLLSSLTRPPDRPTAPNSSQSSVWLV